MHIVYQLYAALIAVAQYFVSTIVPAPYMDEFFHYNTTMEYVAGNFSYWNDKVTTPPGLYLLAVPYVKLIQWANAAKSLSLDPLVCLRVLVSIFGLGNLYLISKITSAINRSEKKVLLFAFSLAMFPVLFFFSSLYYTDIPSVFFVLLSYYWSIKQVNLKSCVISAIAGFVAVTLRQTNIIWVGFICMSFIQRYAISMGADETIYSFVRRLAIHLARPLEFIVTAFYFIPYILVLFAFVLFLYYNGGVVLGDKVHHVATFCPIQILYFSIVVILPYTFSFKWLYKRKQVLGQITFYYYFKIFLLYAFCFLLVRFYSQPVHPFILSDNRHLTFYLNRHIFQNPLYPFVAPVFYAVSLHHLVRTMRHETSEITFYSYFICLFLVLSFESLLEPRYFMIPLLLFAMNTKLPSYKSLFIQIANYTLIDLILFCVFLGRPYSVNCSGYQEGVSESLCRFML